MGNRLLRRIGLRNYLLHGGQSDAPRIGEGAAINLQALVMRNIFSLRRQRDNQEGQQVPLHRDEAETNSTNLYRLPRHEAPNKVTFRSEDLQQRLTAAAAATGDTTSPNVPVFLLLPSMARSLIGRNFVLHVSV